jgi:hypothetical protein
MFIEHEALEFGDLRKWRLLFVVALGVMGAVPFALPDNIALPAPWLGMWSILILVFGAALYLLTGRYDPATITVDSLIVAGRRIGWSEVELEPDQYGVVWFGKHPCACPAEVALRVEGRRIRIRTDSTSAPMRLRDPFGRVCFVHEVIADLVDRSRRGGR